jgi:trimethylamine--corrinoid protein Co-methyltransferase
VLSEDQKKQIHEAVTAVLWKTGVRVEEPEALRILARAGAQVEGERVRLPAEVLARALQQAPRVVTIYDRDGEEAMRLGTEAVYFGTHSDTPDLLDSATGRLRPFRLADVGQMARLCDALPNIDFIAMSGFAEDISNPTVIPALAMARMMRNSSKPLGLGANDVEATRRMLEIACAVRAGKDDLAARPFFYYYSEPLTPLAHSPFPPEDHAGKWSADPVVYTPMVMAGATGPASRESSCRLWLTPCPASSWRELSALGAMSPVAFPIMDMATTICSYGAGLSPRGLTEMVSSTVTRVRHRGADAPRWTAARM